MDDAEDLLKRLTINRQGEDKPVFGRSGRQRLVKNLIVGVLCLLGGYFLFSLLWFDRQVAPSEKGGKAVQASGSLLGETREPIIEAKEPSRQAVAGGSTPAAFEKSASRAAFAAEDRIILNASGYVTARRMATVSAELTGRITDILIEEGMRVEKNQILAKLDDAIIKLDVALAKARVREAEAERARIMANLGEAGRDTVRARALRAGEFASEARLSQAEATLAALEADLARAEANIDIARLQAEQLMERLADHTIRAPFAGVVTVKAAQPGEIVSPSSAGGGFTRTGICTIVDMESLEIEVDVNEAFIGRIAPQQKVEAKLDAYADWIIDAEVIAIIPTANRDKATVKVRIAIKNLDPRILPDMGVKVSFFDAQ